MMLRPAVDMAVASLCGGLALANAGLGAVHGFAGPFGGMIGGPHGAICAALLPHVMAMNLDALRSRQPDSPAITRYDKIGRLLTHTHHADVDDAVDWVADLCIALHVPPLRDHGLEPNHFDDLIAKAKQSSSMRGNPVQLTDDEMKEILLRAI